MGSVNLSATLTAGSSLASGVSVSYVLSGHPAAGALVTPSPTVAFKFGSTPAGSSSLSGALLYRLSASLVGGATLTASTLEEDLAASLVGASSVAPNATAKYSPSISYFGSSHVAASPHALLALVAAPVGGSSLSAFWGQFLGGVAAGVSTVTGTAQLVHTLFGAAHGTATLSASTLLQTLLLSGTASGVGDFHDNIVVNLSGMVTGFGTTNNARLSAELLASGYVFGSGTTHDTAPLPIFGRGTVLGFLQVDRVLPPIDCPPPHPDCDDGPDRFRPIVAHKPYYDRRGFQHPYPEPDQFPRKPSHPCPQQFRLGHIFTLGDLQITLTDTTGTQFRSPFRVIYTLFQLTKSGVPMQAGPTKTAVKQSNGLFYVVGTAGEGGQPGNWLVRWAYQMSFGDDFITIDQPFQVVDSISAPIVGDPTCRKTKYGWD